MQCQATCHCPQCGPRSKPKGWRFGGRRSLKLSFQKLLSPPPHLFHVETSDTHSLESPPTPLGQAFPMQISSQVGETCAPSFPGRGAVAAAFGCQRCRPLPWARRWSLSAWPLCRCHSDSYGSILAWRCCPEGRVHHLTGQGEGTSSNWWGCRERGTRSRTNNARNLQHQSHSIPPQAAN